MRQITVVEIMLTYISIGWAFVLFTSPELFDNNSNWEKIQSIANYEWVLGIIVIICAATKILGMVIQNKRLRWVGLIMSTVLWVFISASFLVSNDVFKISTGFITYSGLAVMSLWTSKEVMKRERAD